MEDFPYSFGVVIRASDKKEAERLAGEIQTAIYERDEVRSVSFGDEQIVDELADFPIIGLDEESEDDGE